MNPHNWLNRVSWEVWVYNVTSLWFFWLGMTTVLFCRGRKLHFFYTKMVESLLGWRIYKPLSETFSISNSTDIVSVPNDEYVSLHTNTHLLMRFFSLQVFHYKLFLDFFAGFFQVTRFAINWNYVILLPQITNPQLINQVKKKYIYIKKNQQYNLIRTESYI